VSWWEILDDRGIRYTSKMNAVKELVRRPDATFINRSTSMAGTEDRDITEEITAVLQERRSYFGADEFNRIFGGNDAD
jgi:hypothetical protein